jgi:hypothetical protein
MLSRDEVTTSTKLAIIRPYLAHTDIHAAAQANWALGRVNSADGRFVSSLVIFIYRQQAHGGW